LTLRANNYIGLVANEMTTQESDKEKNKIDNELSGQVNSYDAVVANSIFPDPASVFTSTPKSLAEAKDTACIILDTNALLVPFGIGAQTLSEVEATYKKLLSEKRLIIPAQVAREFARNRVGKLAELHQKLFRSRSKLQPFRQGSYPLLETLPEYIRLRELENQLDKLVNDYRQSLGSVIDHVASWEWNDPVSLLYGKLFSAEVVVDTNKALGDIRQEHLRRFNDKVPPGYKDSTKDDKGIGDFLIWLTILEIGSSRQTSVIFVSGEEKADWWHNSENQQLYPRFELVDEFRRASGGSSFHIIKFSRFLELYGASTTVVAEIRKEEKISLPTVPLPKFAEIHLRSIGAAQSVAFWLMESGYEVSSPPDRSHYDYVAEKDKEAFAVEILYMRNTLMIPNRLENVARRQKSLTDIPLVVVVVGETQEIAERAEAAWLKLDPPYRLCTGLLDSQGHFEVLKPL
jgi:hypothetical protein